MIECFKLKSAGPHLDFIGDLEDDKNEVIIRKVRLVQIVPDSTNEQTGAAKLSLIGWLQGDVDATIPIKKSEFLGRYKPNPDIESYYVQSTTNIQIVQGITK